MAFEVKTSIVHLSSASSMSAIHLPSKTTYCYKNFCMVLSRITFRPAVTYEKIIDAKGYKTPRSESPTTTHSEVMP